MKEKVNLVITQTNYWTKDDDSLDFTVIVYNFMVTKVITAVRDLGLKKNLFVILFTSTGNNCSLYDSLGITLTNYILSTEFLVQS